MNKFVAAVVLACSFATFAEASIDLVTDKPAGSPLLVDSGSISVDKMLLSVVNNGGSPNLAGWQVTLWVEPIGGATGNVGFNSAVLPAVNYVLAPLTTTFGLNATISTMTTTDDSLTAFDFDSPPLEGGVPVPASPGAGLMDLDFVASANASGTFGVYGVGGLGFSEWTEPPDTAHFFDNLDNATGSHTLIGTVRIIPEPTSLLIWGVIGGASFLFIRLRRSR